MALSAKRTGGYRHWYNIGQARFSEFPSCCGLEILHEFGYYGGYSKPLEQLPLAPWLEPAEAVNALKARVSSWEDEVAAIAAVSSSWQRGLDEVLAAAGFVAVKAWENPNTDAIITLWTFDFVKPKKLKA